MIEPASWRWTPEESEQPNSSEILLIGDSDDGVVRIQCGTDSIKLYSEEALGLLSVLRAWAFARNYEVPK